MSIGNNNYEKNSEISLSGKIGNSSHPLYIVKLLRDLSFLNYSTECVYV